jgi:protein gp37/ParB-like chromosome segregation protein Spo0J
MTETRPIGALRPHPRNAEIYGDQADADLVESVHTRGVLNPLLITRDGIVIAGHRRLDAARRAGLSDAPVVLFGSDDELDILEALVESNRQREKTREMFGREGLVLLHVEAERAKRRQAEQARLNQPQASIQTIQNEERVPHSGKQPRAPQARDLAAAKIGISGRHLEKATAVVSTIDTLKAEGKTREAEQLRSTLNGKSVRAAYAEAREKGHIQPGPKPVLAPTELAKSGPLLLADWRRMDEATRQASLLRPRSPSAKFNEQKGNSIEWALWSWNPVTGCLHNCSYCYARDIAERYYDWKFTPAFLPERLAAPRNTAVPAEAKTNIGYRNVFVCSMADLFGKWVPREWIEAVLDVVAENQQWNFLFLTKFPLRLAEFDFPDNAWVGTSVDAQARVANAERAFENVRARVKWLSCEPMLERLTFDRLDLFNWIVVGGASRSTETPAFRPPREWVEHIERQARDAGVCIYEKENLHPLERLREYPGGETATSVNVAEAFKMGYLQRDVEKPNQYALEFEESPHTSQGRR